MSILQLPLNTLCLSRLNVRHTERDADIAALAEDIAARGLKQNLVVVPAHFTTGEAEADWQDKWEVIAGGRRFQAMQLLVADGRLPADHDVPCLIEDRNDASETSLSENLHKVAMNPADEFAAFHAIVTQRENQHHDTRDAAIAHCAKRFGKTTRHVEGRLRLATLAPEILDALRANVIGIESAKAYARVTNHDLQRAVFASHEKDKWRAHKPEQVRSDLGGLTLPIDHALAQFVGLVTYQAEGGRIEAEMFMGAEGKQVITDVRLLEKLAAKIAGDAIPALAKQLGYKSGLYAKGVGRYANWPKAPDGYERAWDYHEAPTKADLKKSVGLFAVGHDGVLEAIGRVKPIKAVAKAPARDWNAERAAERRARTIRVAAARMAVPSADGTPFDGLIHWDHDDAWENTIEIEDDSDHVFINALIKVPVSAIEANYAEAERRLYPADADQGTPLAAAGDVADEPGVDQGAEAAE